MSENPPPIDDAPLFAPCPACRRVLRARVDLRVRPARGSLPCPWCRQRVSVEALG